MSVDKNEEFWKELMGEDFKVDLDPPPEKKPAPPPPAPEAPAAEPAEDSGLREDKLGFTIEYVDRDGNAAGSQPHRVQPAQPEPAQPPVQRPVQQPTPGTQQPAQRPVQQPVQRSVQQPAPSNPQPMQRPVQQPTPGAQQPAQRPVQQPVQRPVQQPTPGTQQPTQRPVQQPAPSTPQPTQRPVQQPAPGTPQPTQRPVRQPAQPVRRDGEGSVPRPEELPRGKRGKDPADNFEVEFDFDEEYPDVDEKAIRRGRTKRTGCLSGILMFIFVVCVSAVLASLGWIWATDVLGLDGEDVPVEVTIPKEYIHTEERQGEDENGEPITETVDVADIDLVAEELYQKGLIRYKWLFKLFSRFAHGDTKVEAGTFTLNMNFDYRALIHGMSARTGARKTVDVTIPEGYSITQIVHLMDENEVCEPDELLDTLANYDFDYDFLDSGTLGDPKRLEGYMFPDTYQFYVGDNPVNVVKKFLNNFQKKWTEEFDEQAATLGYTRHEILIVASMIEKEAGSDAERDSIARVIYNRLEHPDRQGTNGLLQIDATIYYVIADTGEAFSTELDTPYNTYLYPGLPAGPISNPGLASIRAALNPSENDFYYYALSKAGTHKFFKTYAEFTKFVNSDQYGG